MNEYRFTTFNFYGHSDDVFQAKSNIQSIHACGLDLEAVFVIENQEGDGIKIIGRYEKLTKQATWAIAVAQMDEDVPIPDWNIKLSTAPNGYSPLLSIDVPVDSIISNGKYSIFVKEEN